MFDPRKQTPNFHNHILDTVTTLTDSWEPHNFDFQVSQKLGNQFRVQKMKDRDDDDGVECGASSPPLWQNSPPRSPVHPVINYRSLSPSSRTQAIARGQWELMEMVKNMPESCFELSLKDLVEHPKSFESQENCLINKEKNKVVQNRVKIKKNDEIRKAKMMRSKSIENGGLFLKMISPVSLRSNKNKKSLSVNTTRVSPKPEEYCDNSTKSLEKEWRKKRFSGSSSGSSNNSGSTGRNRSAGSSSSSSSSTNSRNNSNRKRKGILRSCWSSLCFSNSISTG